MDHNAVKKGELPRSNGKLTFSHSAKVSQYHLAIVGQGVRNGNDLVRKGKSRAALPLVHTQADFLSAKKEMDALPPGLARVISTSPLGHAFEQPCLASFQEPDAFGLGTAPGDDQTHRAVRLNPEQVSSGAGPEDDLDSDAMFPNQGLIDPCPWQARRFKAVDLLTQKIQGELEHGRIVTTAKASE